MFKRLMAIISFPEVLALIGAGLFVFGVWQIYKPAAFMFTGAALIAPFWMSFREAK